MRMYIGAGSLTKISVITSQKQVGIPLRTRLKSLNSMLLMLPLCAGCVAREVGYGFVAYICFPRFSADVETHVRLERL